MVGSEEERDAALEIAWSHWQGRRIEDNIEISDVLSGDVGGLDVSEVVAGAFEGSTADAGDERALEAGDFTAQETIHDPELAAGPSDSLEDVVADGDEVYTPPVDPVGNNREVIGGFQASSMDSVEVERSADGTIGDEAIRDAVLRELREDSATTAMELDVSVEGGVVRLRGTVADLEDTDNAAEVASRVPGVVEVVDELEVEGM
jgi:osmotically-inducible protein OsmY